MAAAGVPDTIAKIQALAATVSGVTSAPGAYPSAVHTSQLPMVLTWAGQATTKAVTFAGVKRVSERAYEVACLVDAYGQDTASSRLNNANVLLQAMLDKFTNTVIAAELRVIDQITDTGIVTGDSGYAGIQARLIYNGQGYTGFVLSVRVQETLAV